MPFFNVDLLLRAVQRIPLSTEHASNPVSFTAAKFGTQFCFFESNFITRHLLTDAVRVVNTLRTGDADLRF